MIIIGVPLVIGLWGIGQHAHYRLSNYKQKISNASNEINLTPIQPSLEVLNAIKARKNAPVKVIKQEFQGLPLAPDLGTERLVLRGFEERDLDDFTTSLADYETVYMLVYMPWPFDRERVLDYIRRISWDTEHGHSLYWALTLPGKDRLMGVIGLTLEHAHDRAELHFWLQKEYQGKGYMTEAARRVVDYVFKDLCMNRLDVNHLTINKASQRVIEKCGFKLECERDDFAKKEGKYQNMKYYRILRREYLKK
jgi:RimJ/RimL family protein N-acetyltransferase